MTSNKLFKNDLYRENYHKARTSSTSVKFSLECRINAIADGLLKLFPGGVERLLDVGSADGLLAEGISQHFSKAEQIYAIDFDFHLLNYNKFPSVQANSYYMPFADDSFDVITAAALIEHLPDPQPFLKECFRILRPGGILFLTCPDPFFDWLATKLGYLRNAGHMARYNLADLGSLCLNAGLTPILSKKFMISPFYFSGYSKVEFLMRKFGFSFLMMNQLIGSKKEKI